MAFSRHCHDSNASGVAVPSICVLLLSRSGTSSKDECQWLGVESSGFVVLTADSCTFRHSINGGEVGARPYIGLFAPFRVRREISDSGTSLIDFRRLKY